MILQGDCFELIKNIESKSVDLILVDPPYLISRDSNFSKYSDETSKEMANKYGSISIDFGDWDEAYYDGNILLLDGEGELWKNPCKCNPPKSQRVSFSEAWDAAVTARSARFEHGESGV